MSSMDDAVDDEEMWTSPPFSASSALPGKLRTFEDSLRCPICREFLQIPVSLLPCHHSFCSECIRSCIRTSLKGMKRMASCPVCRVQVSGDENKSLIPNRTVETMVHTYKGLRGDLRDSLCQLTSNGSSTQVSEVSNDATVEEEVVDRKRRRVNTRSSSSASSAPSVEAVSVAAPAAVAKKPPQEVTHRRAKRHATHYHSLKKKMLVDLCEHEGLSTTGSEKELRARHQEFVTLYNAECDSFTPRSPAELAREIARRERARAREEEMMQSKNKSGNQKHDDKNHDNFAKLIAQAKSLKRKVTLDKEKEDATFAQAASTPTSAPPFLPPDRFQSPALPSVMPPSGRTPNVSFTDNSPSPLISYPPASGVPQPAAVVPAAKSAQPEQPHVGQETSINSSVEKVSPTSASDTKLPRGALPSSRQTSTSLKGFVVTNQARTKPSQPSSSTKAGRSSICGPWHCQTCTYLNETRTWSRAKCEMCGNTRPSPDEASTPDAINDSPDAMDASPVVLLDV